MKNIVSSACAVLLALLLVLTLARVATAQDGAAQRYVWTGVRLENGVRIGSPPVLAESTVVYGDGARGLVQRVHPRAHAEALERELASIQLGIEVDGRWEEAQQALDELWVRAAWRETYAGRRDVLTQLALARAVHLARRGQGEAARAALGALWPDAGALASFGARFELVPADEAALAEERAALAEPALLAAEAQLKSGPAGQAPAQSTDSAIEARVRDFVENRQMNSLLDIGVRAAPALEKLIAEDPEAYPVAETVDPLYWLLLLDEGRGARAVTELARKGGFMARKRSLRDIKSADVLGDEGTWSPGADPRTPPLLIEREWVPALEALAEHADVRGETCTAVRMLAVQDALTPKLQQLLIAALRDNEAGTRQAALATLDGVPRRASVSAVMRAVLDHPEAAVRRAAAEHLLSEPDPNELLSRVRDEDVEVRRRAVRSLGRRQVWVPVYRIDGSLSKEGRNFTPQLGKAGLDALTVLAADPVASVRSEAYRILLGLETPVAKEVYVRMADDPDADARAVVLKEIEIGNPALAEILNKLATDTDPDVRHGFEERLEKVAHQGPPGESASFEPFLPGYLAYLHQLEGEALAKGNAVWGSALHRALHSPRGIREVLPVLLAKANPRQACEILERMPFQPSGSAAAVEPVPPSAALRALDPGLLVKLLLLAESAGDKATGLENACAGARRDTRAGADLSAAWNALLADATTARRLRVHAAGVACIRASEESLRNIHALLCDASWKAQPLTSEEHRGLVAFAEELGRAQASATILAWIQDRAVQDAPLSVMLARGIEVRDSEGWSQPILERFLGATSNEAYQLVSVQLMKLPASPDARALAVLRQAVRQPYAGPWAVRSMARMRHPEVLELLGACLSADWLADAAARGELQKLAAVGLTANMSEAAAEKLLAGVTQAVTKEARDACLDGLAQIRQYLDERQRWLVRDNQLEQRAEAVRQVVLLLADPDAATRAQAARSLATLDALEHLPKLIALLKDKSPEVRAAAQQALDQLNARSVKKN